MRLWEVTIIKIPCKIELKHIHIGKDSLFLITGGVEHIGAIATAYWDKGEIHLSINELPHHKEGKLASECAEFAAKILSCTCTVVMGIHVDNATIEDIENIINLVKQELNTKLNKYKKLLN